MAEETVQAEDLRRAAASCARALTPMLDHDWSLRPPDMDWSARDTLEHVVRALFNYATQLESRSLEPKPYRIGPLLAADGRSPAPPEALISALQTMVGVLADVVAVAPDEARAYHVFGLADSIGFAAMGCDEMLIHTYDITRAFGLSFHPPGELCRRVLARLFPWAPTDADPWAALRWANGREALPNHERLGPEWGWQAAPLEEWDGNVVRMPPGA